MERSDLWRKFEASFTTAARREDAKVEAVRMTFGFGPTATMERRLGRSGNCNFLNRVRWAGDGS